METRWRELYLLESVDSTNRYLRDAAAGGAPEGRVAIARYQTAGRGRLDRRWDSPPGAGLLMSVLVRPSGLDRERYHLLSAAVALAAREACWEVAGFRPGLKWPNDLVVGNKKLAGVLAEVVTAPSGGAGGAGAGGAGAAGAGGAGLGGAGAGGAEDTPGVVIGIGLNVSWAPPGATSVTEAGDRAATPALLAEALLVSLEGYLDGHLGGGWHETADVLAAEYRSCCVTIGKSVQVETSAGTFRGRAVGIDPAGRLLVLPGAEGRAGAEVDRGRAVAVSSGDVVHLRGL